MERRTLLGSLAALLLPQPVIEEKRMRLKPIPFYFQYTFGASAVDGATVLANTSTNHRIAIQAAPGSYRVYEYLGAAYGSRVAGTIFSAVDQPRPGSASDGNGNLQNTIVRMQPNQETVFPIIRSANINTNPGSETTYSDLLATGISKWFTDLDYCLAFSWTNPAGLPGAQMIVRGRYFESASLEEIMCVYLGL